MTPELFIAAARSHVGTRFVHQGRSAGSGLDCIGLLVLAAREAGIAIEDQTDYGRDPNPRQLLAAFDAQFDPIAPSTRRAGDLLLFAWRRSRRHGLLPQHLGLVAERDGRESLVHAYDRVSRVVETSLDERWTSRIHSCYRFKIWQQ